MSDPSGSTTKGFSRRGVLGLAGATAALAAVGTSRAASRLFPAAPNGGRTPFDSAADTGPILSGPPVKIRFAYNGTGVCSAAVPVALHRGYFAQQNLDVEFLALAGSTDQMLEALATNKAEVGISMLLSWLKPLESGFDVKLTTGIHGGCVRLLADKESPYSDITRLKGATIGVSKMAGSPKHFISVLLHLHGIDPDKEVQWREYPAEFLGGALDKGEVQAVADADPFIWLTLKRSNGKLAEIASNLSEKYANLSCCTLGIAGNLVQSNPLVAAALTRAIRLASAHVYTSPDDAAAVFSPYTPKVAVADLAAMLRSHTHDHHPLGADLREEVVTIIDDLKLAHIIKPGTDARRFANRIVIDLPSA